MAGCGFCHRCGTRLRECLDGEEWCPTCGMYRRYATHGWPMFQVAGVERGSCPTTEERAALRCRAYRDQKGEQA